MARGRGTTRGFPQSVNKWTKKMEERSIEAYQNGALDFHDALSAATPVLTGNLRNSLIAQVGDNISTVTGPGNTSSDSTYRSGAEDSIRNIMNLKLGDKVSYVYLAPHFRRLNYGFSGFDSLGRYYNQSGRFWVEQVGSQYRSIMRRAATRLKMASK